MQYVSRKPLGSAPSSSSHLGFWVQGTSVSTTTSSTPASLYSISLIAGNWIIFGNATFGGGNAYVVLSISSTNNSRDGYYEVQFQPVTGASGQPVINISRGVSISTTTTFYLVGHTTTVTSCSNIIMYAMRVG